MITLITSNEEIDDTMKIFKALQEFRLLMKGVIEPSGNEAKEKKVDFLA